MSTGENWNQIMTDCMASSIYGAPLFIIYIIFIQNVMLKLFVLVLLNDFNDFFYNSDNPLNKFYVDLEVFKI
jgi:hypothetical protein